MVAVRKDRSRASAQAGFIRPLCPGQHWGLRPLTPPCSSLWISFVKKSRRGGTGWRLHFYRSRGPNSRDTSPRASPVRVRILPRAPFRPASIKVMQRTFNPLNRERYPGGPPIAGSSNRRTAPFEGANAGAIPAPAANFRPVVIAIREANVPPWAPDLQGLGSPIVSRLAYTQKSEGQNVPGRPFASLHKHNQ